MKYKVRTNKSEKGITLIALIITIIVLVILAAVTLNSIFGSNIIGLATNGAINYSEEQQKELGMLDEVSDLLGEITGDTDRPMMPSITLGGDKGNNNIFTTNVTVAISINRQIGQTEVIKLHYQINGGEEQITEEDVSLTIETEGTTTVTAWTENEKGNLSDKKETSFTINKTAPSNPTIRLNGDLGDNNYYKSNVGVTINAGDASNIASIRYKVEGANPIEETEVQGTTASFDITQDGTSTITAYIINNAGLTSETITEVVNKDVTPPSTATIALSGEVGETSINVTATGADTTSGVASYTFEYSTTSETEGFTTALEVQNTSNSCTYTYENLASDTTYYLRVIVKDRAGNTTTSTAVETKTKQSGLSDTELASNIGAYVDYTPVSGSYSSSSTYNGSSTTQSFQTNTDTQWQILFVNDDTVTLIAEDSTNDRFYLEGANGYNNGVKLLNDACYAMYSNSSLGAVARSVDIDDIEAVSSFDKTSDSDYGEEYSASSKYYPNIFKEELTGSVDGKYGSTLDLSDQTDWVTGSTKATILGGKCTDYSYTMSTRYMSSTYVNMFNNGTNYWLASRCVSYDSFVRYFNFSMFEVSEYGDVISYDLYRSSNYSDSSYYTSVRPVVEIDLSKVNIGLTGDGSKNSQYSIEAK